MASALKGKACWHGMSCFYEPPLSCRTDAFCYSLAYDGFAAQHDVHFALVVGDQVASGRAQHDLRRRAGVIVIPALLALAISGALHSREKFLLAAVGCEADVDFVKIGLAFSWFRNHVLTGYGSLDLAERFQELFVGVAGADEDGFIGASLFGDVVEAGQLGTNTDYEGFYAGCGR